MPLRIMCAAIVVLSLQTTRCFAQAEMIWLRPNDPGAVTHGATITGGDQYKIMRFLAAHMPALRHTYETYPVKRNWALIQSREQPDKAYCFLGAAYTEARTQWGYYSRPTSVALPHPLVARKNTLRHLAQNDQLSVATLFAKRLTTVRYDGVENIWVQTLKALQPDEALLLRLNPSDKNIHYHTLELLGKGRIDFGYVSHQSLKNIPPATRQQIDIFILRN